MLTEHLYWHGSNRYGAEWAADYLNAPICDWTPEEVDFVDWVFNSATVLKERAKLMELHEGLSRAIFIDYEGNIDREPCLPATTRARKTCRRLGWAKADRDLTTSLSSIIRLLWKYMSMG